MRRLSLIVAMTRSGVIGRHGTLPWKLSADLKRFKTLTMGHHLIMGRKTFDSLGGALPGRTSIIITHQPAYQPLPEVLVVGSIDEALQLAAGDEELFIIGGGQIFRQALGHAKRMYVTWVEADVEGDTWFPDWNPAEWQATESERRSADDKNQYDYTFCIYDRRPL